MLDSIPFGAIHSDIHFRFLIDSHLICLSKYLKCDANVKQIINNSQFKTIARNHWLYFVWNYSIFNLPNHYSQPSIAHLKQINKWHWTWVFFFKSFYFWISFSQSYFYCYLFQKKKMFPDIEFTNHCLVAFNFIFFFYQIFFASFKHMKFVFSLNDHWLIAPRKKRRRFFFYA